LEPIVFPFLMPITILLLATPHPVQTDFRVEVDIHLVFVHRDVTTGQRG